MSCCPCLPEFKGWCRSFTRTEALLAILQAVLLVICIFCIVFLILHFLVCGKQLPDGPVINSTSTPVHRDDDDKTTTPITIHTTLNASVKCTWDPSQKTAASTRYYEVDQRVSTPSGAGNSSREPVVQIHDIDDLEGHDSPDGEEDDFYKEMALALVKINPQRGYTFGCFLTAISEYWTVTAASCVEAVEETDSVEVFVMVERWGGLERGGGGVQHAVSDVRVWPPWAGPRLAAQDLAALRSASSLRGLPALLPALLDYYTLTLGERLMLLGFGGYRSEGGGGVRAVGAALLPAGECGSGGGWAGRHLAGGAARRAGRCSGAAPLCAGGRGGGWRAAPCHYCAGSPLLRGRTLLAVMSDAPLCGITCDPALFVNIAAALPWIQQLDNDEDIE